MWADNETSEDFLGFKVHADLLIDVIKDDKVLPVTIGVFGDWGSGKSSVLKIVHENLTGKGDELKDDTLVLYFNGWVFEGYDDAKAALLDSIIKGFSDNKTIGAKVKNKAKKLLKSVKWMRILGLGFKKIVLPSAAAYFSGGVSLLPMLADQLAKATANPQDLIQRLQGSDTQEYLKSLVNPQPEEDESTLVREFREDFSEMIEESSIRKLVVIIDDLDRCTPERIIENLEAIKLFLNVEKTAFIIGADPRIVRHAIEHRYQTKNKGQEDSGGRIVDDYLEKLIQIPYHLPKLSDSEVETYISLLICKRELKEAEFTTVVQNFNTFKEINRYSVFGLGNIKIAVSETSIEALTKGLTSISALVPVITTTLSGNPRQIKRFLNTLTLRQRLAQVAKIPNFSNAILAKLMVLEYAELNLFKQLYDWQLQSSGSPTQLKLLESICKDKSIEEAKSEVEKSNEIKEWNRDRIIKWLKVEPLLSDVDLSDYFWLSRDKIASSIPGSSLIPPMVKAVYSELDQEQLTNAVSKKIISEKVLKMDAIEQALFLGFCAQMLIKNPKKKRGYDIFHLLLDEKVINAENQYGKALADISISDMPISVGESLKRYDKMDPIKNFIEKSIKNSDKPIAKAYKKK
jgi:predicted KAP-like P-loop ATPase